MRSGLVLVVALAATPARADSASVPTSPVTSDTGSGRPACQAGLRGTQWDTFGGTAVKDVLAVCNKDETDTYNWDAVVNEGSLVWGDGSDGGVVISGTVTLVRDMYYNKLTVQNGGVLNTAGFRIFVRTLLTVDAGGIIRRNGNAGSGATAGAALPIGSLAGSSAGGTGQILPTAGAAAANSFGGNGGAGGLGSTAGAAGGVATTPPATFGGLREHHGACTGEVHGAGGSAFYLGGAGGGGGQGPGGGGGGSGGGVVLIVVYSILNNGMITANGGDGAAATSGNSGGGGGGGGGIVVVINRLKNNLGTITANGGAGGAKAGTGVNGSLGIAGTFLYINN